MHVCVCTYHIQMCLPQLVMIINCYQMDTNEINRISLIDVQTKATSDICLRHLTRGMLNMVRATNKYRDKGS